MLIYAGIFFKQCHSGEGFLFIYFLTGKIHTSRETKSTRFSV